MERFTYWATLLALPFVGLLAKELCDRYRTRAVVGLTLVAGLSCALAMAWGEYRPADAVDFKVDSVAAWLNRDGHDRCDARGRAQAGAIVLRRASHEIP